MTMPIVELAVPLDTDSASAEEGMKNSVFGGNNGNHFAPEPLKKFLPTQRNIQTLCVWLYESAEQRTRLDVMMPDIPAQLKTGLSSTVADSIADWVWKNQQLLIISTKRGGRFPDYARGLLEAGIGSICGVPLTLANHHIGVLGLVSSEPDAFQPHTLQFVHHYSVAGLEDSEKNNVTSTKTLIGVERDYIKRMLAETKWVIGGPNGAAIRLGLPRTTLISKMKKLGIAPMRTKL